jgi:hypothetical protein
MSKTEFEQRVQAVEHHLKSLTTMLNEVSNEPETDDTRTALVHLKAAQKYYTDLRIKLHN